MRQEGGWLVEVPSAWSPRSEGGSKGVSVIIGYYQLQIYETRALRGSWLMVRTAAPLTLAASFVTVGAVTVEVVDAGFDVAAEAGAEAAEAPKAAVADEGAAEGPGGAGVGADGGPVGGGGDMSLCCCC